ncbi:transposase [Paucibacter sp. APW11]|uniref:Transposase n=1 Tax=Roseateles aquae TaxID=3077235 RepID=A0ABU3PE44_9BURK|nr:transposase [Paucibacter sp. APW11]MDT9000605.1 transposase [Paucibacter sp. APW11]
MARPLRIEYAGAVYHLSSKAEAGAVVFSDDEDRRALLGVIAQAMQRFDAQVLAYHLGSHHYELVLYTRQANLSRLMRHLNGVYTQGFNRRHGGHGHLFQGRFKAVLVDREKRLLDVCRYVELAAVREGLAKSSLAWPWSSHAAHCGNEPAPDWLDVDGLLGFVQGRPIAGAAERKRAAQRYEKLVASEPGLDIWPHLRHQVFLGDAEFAAAQRQLLQTQGRQSTRAASALRARGWRDWLRDCGSREEALYRAHTDGGLSMTGLAQELALSVSRVSRLIAAYERAQRSH